MTNNSLGFAMVTGASSGIGTLYAERLATRGYDLILVARRHDRLADLAEKIRAASGRSVEIISADLANKDDLKRVEAVLRSDQRVTMLVNNAGIAAVTPLLQSDVDQMSSIISLNSDALMRLTYAVVPGFVERAHGTIINIASVVAIAPEALNGVYGASKAFVYAFSQSLKHELQDKGIRIQVVLPGATATDLWENSGLPVESLPPEMVMRADVMVDASLIGFDQEEFATIPALEDASELAAYEGARKVLAPKLSRAKPATRYAT